MTTLRYIGGPRADEEVDVDTDAIESDYPRKGEPVPLDGSTAPGGVYWLQPGKTDPRVATWTPDHPHASTLLHESRFAVPRPLV